MLDLSLRESEPAAADILNELLAWGPQNDKHWLDLQVDEIVQICTDATYKAYHQSNQEWAADVDKFCNSSWIQHIWLRLTGQLPKWPPNMYELLEELADKFKMVSQRMNTTSQLTNEQKDNLLSYIHKPVDVEAALRAGAM